MIEIHPPADRAILVAAPRRGSADDAHAEEHLDELERLADTAGAVVVARVTQRLPRLSPRLYIGPGKLEELEQLVCEHEATLVIFDDELSPAQGKNLEAALERRVMDRAELILDIFATRAKTKEAKMQVELAQLEYLLPRLARMWVHLSRIRGGIGLRGPGETQLETDRRMIRRKISQLRKNLERVARHRETLRKGRRDIPTAALVGYTNAGKSSILRAMAGVDVFVEDRLFATLDTLTREVYLAPGAYIRLIDTVGFIRKLPHHLVASFRATLEEASSSDVLLHVVDASQPDWEEQLQVVDQVLADLQLNGSPVIHVFNKLDLVEASDRVADRLKARYDDAVCVSALAGNVGELKEKLEGIASAGRPARRVAGAG
jgi:GTP-binding protein HflX